MEPAVCPCPMAAYSASPASAPHTTQGCSVRPRTHATTSHVLETDSAPGLEWRQSVTISVVSCGMWSCSTSRWDSVCAYQDMEERTAVTSCCVRSWEGLVNMGTVPCIGRMADRCVCVRRAIMGLNVTKGISLQVGKYIPLFLTAVIFSLTHRSLPKCSMSKWRYLFLGT